MIFFRKGIFLFVVVLFLSGCVPYKYFTRDKVIENQIIATYSLHNEPYKIQPYDYLYVSIKSTNESINDLYAKISSDYSRSLASNEANFYLTGYLVNDSGYVFIPTLGNINVKGLTISEVRQEINDRVHKILKDAVVNVRLTSFRVSFIGELNRCGSLSFYKERVNILEAIAKAGDITAYGDKKHVKVFRQKDTSIVVYELDLTDKNLMKQKNFFIYPNDIIYVPPRGSKDLILAMGQYSSIISALATTTSLILIILQTLK